MKRQMILNIVICIVFSIILYMIIIQKYMKYTITNWSKNATGVFDEMYTPKNMDELVSVMQQLKSNTPIIISGGKHSWSPTLYSLGTNTNYSSSTPVFISMLGLSGIISYEHQNSSITCLSGTYMGELLYYLAMHKQTLDTYPNTPYITIGGAIATCSHGASLTTGTISDLVTDLYYILPGDKEVRRVPNDLLGAYASSLGQLGVICIITLKTRPISWLRQTNSVLPSKTFIQNLPMIINKTDLLRILWNYKTDTCKVLQFNRIPNTNNDVVSLYPCKIDNHFMVYQSETSMDNINYAPELDTQFGIFGLPLIYNNASGHGQCQKQITNPINHTLTLEAEFALPIENLDIAFKIIKIWIEKYNPVLLVDEFYIRFTGGDTLPWLSNVKGKSNKYVWIIVDLELHSPTSADKLQILQTEMWKQADGRPHLGKWNNLDHNTFIEMYGDYGRRFLELGRKKMA